MSTTVQLKKLQGFEMVTSNDGQRFWSDGPNQRGTVSGNYKLVFAEDETPLTVMQNGVAGCALVKEPGGYMSWIRENRLEPAP